MKTKETVCDSYEKEKLCTTYAPDQLLVSTYRSPNENGKSLHQFQPNLKVKVRDVEETWLAVEYKRGGIYFGANRDAWIHKKNIECDEAFQEFRIEEYQVKPVSVAANLGMQ